MKKGMTYKVVARKTALMPKGTLVLNDLKKGAKVAGNVIFADDPVTTRVSVYLDTTDKRDMIGMVESVEDSKGNGSIAEDLREKIQMGYEAEIIGAGELPNTIIVKFTELLMDNKNTKKVASSEFDPEVERIVKAGYATEAEVRERIGVMQGLGVSNKLIMDVLAQYRTYKRPAKRPSTIWVNPYKGESIMASAIINLMIGRAQIFEGPKSVGKNVAIETLAWCLNKPLYMNTYNRYMCADDIYGSKTTVPPEINAYSESELSEMALAKIRVQSGKASDSDKEMAAKFDALSSKAAAVQIKQEESELVEAISDGGIYCANEMNLGETNFVSGIMNQLTDGTGFVSVPGVGRVNISPDFSIIGTQNNGYAGTCEQNDATMSRFGTLTFAFPGSVKDQLKAAVFTKAGDGCLDEKYFTQSDKLYKAYLNAVKTGVLQDTCLNIRGFVAALLAVAKYPDETKLSRQLEIQVVSSCAESDRPALLAQISDKINL